MPVNDTFSIPRNTQKVGTITPVSVLQYQVSVGNLPQRKSFSVRIMPSPTTPTSTVVGQAFKARDDRIKAIGVYLKTDFRPVGEIRLGVLKLQLYHWVNYPNVGIGDIVPVSGPTRPGVVEIDIDKIQNLGETVFEFEEPMPTTVDEIYFFTVVQTEGWANERPIYAAISGRTYSPSENGECWTWNGLTGPTGKMEQKLPETDLVFEAFKSITELSVEIVGPGGRNLTDIYDALTINSGANHDDGFGVIDFSKPYTGHGQLVIDGSNYYYNGAGGVPVAWSAIADILVDMTPALWDFAIIRTDERIRIDWGESADILNCGTKFRILEQGDAIVIPEYIQKFAMRLHQVGDTPPTNVSITLWRTIAP